MKKFLNLFIAISALIGGLSGQVFAASKLIKVDGSSTVFPITEAWPRNSKRKTAG